MRRVVCIFYGKDYQCNSDKGMSRLWKHLRDLCKKSPVHLIKELNKAHKSKDKK